MQYKAKYKGKTKKLNHKKITNHQSFRAALQKAFPDCSTDFAVGYFEDQEHIDVQNEDDFELMTDKSRKITVYVRHKDEEPLSFDALDKSKISQRQSNSTAQLSILDSVNQTDKNEPVLQMKQFNKKVQQEKPTYQPSQLTEPNKREQPKTEENPKQANTIQEPSSIQKTQQPPKPAKVNNFIHKDVKCSFCKTKDIKGNHYKCLSCFNYDLCQTCFSQSKHKTAKEHKNKNHQFVQIEDDSFWQRVNYLHAIKKTFNPEYKLDHEDNKIGKWITQDNMTSCSPSFVKVVWNQSQPMAKQILKEYDQWSRENEVA